MKIVWKRAKGGYIFDEKGKRYVDFTSGVMVANIGHANSKILKALKKVIQAPLLYSYWYPYVDKEILREKLLDFTNNDFSDVRFGTTGSEAIEISLKICARYFENKNRNYFLAFKNAFHGKTLGASLLSDINRYKPEKLISSIDLVKRINYPANEKEGKYIMLELEKLYKNCMAVYVECIQGSTLIKVNKYFLQELRRWTKKNGILLVIDEIQTGFYRTGPKFCYLDAYIVPDILCIGKGLTSSLPLSAVLLSKKLINYSTEELDAQTFSSSTFSVAAALASIEEYKSKHFIEKFNNARKDFSNMMKNLITLIDSDIEVVYHGGLYGGLKFNLSKSRQHKIKKFVDMCHNEGLFVSSAVGPELNIIKFTPPLILSSSQIKFANQTLSHVLRRLKLTNSNYKN